MLKVRATLNEGLPEEEHLSLNDMLLKAAAIASEKVPDVSGRCDMLDRVAKSSGKSRHSVRENQIFVRKRFMLHLKDGPYWKHVSSTRACWGGEYNRVATQEEVFVPR